MGGVGREGEERGGRGWMGGGRGEGGKGRGRSHFTVFALQLHPSPHGSGQDILGHGELWTGGEGLSVSASTLEGEREACVCVHCSNSADLP